MSVKFWCFSPPYPLQLPSLENNACSSFQAQILPVGVNHATGELALSCSFIFHSPFFFFKKKKKLSISLHSEPMLLPWLWLIPTYFILNAKYLISSVVHSAQWTHYRVKLNISQMWSTLSSRFSNLIWNLIIDLLLVVGSGATPRLVFACPSLSHKETVISILAHQNIPHFGK